MLYPASENRTGNDRYYGYAIDLIKELAGLCKFNYTFYLSPDSKYGSRQPDGKWNGMVGELIQRVSLTAQFPCQENSFTSGSLMRAFTLTHVQFSCFPESRHRRGRPHHHLRSRASCRLHDTLHEHRDQHPLQEARKIRTGHLLLLVSIFNRSLVLYANGVHLCFDFGVRTGALYSLRMGSIASVRSAIRTREPVQLPAERLLVHNGKHYATRL